uniref:Uncharacterized protein n=2 Tax=Oryza punctata TaxID=4537 RepID=A0A0E0MF00_ORYPU
MNRIFQLLRQIKDRLSFDPSNTSSLRILLAKKDWFLHVLRGGSAGSGVPCKIRPPSVRIRPPQSGRLVPEPAVAAGCDGVEAAAWMWTRRRGAAAAQMRGLRQIRRLPPGRGDRVQLQPPRHGRPTPKLWRRRCSHGGGRCDGVGREISGWMAGGSDAASGVRPVLTAQRRARLGGRGGATGDDGHRLDARRRDWHDKKFACYKGANQGSRFRTCS